MPAKPKPRSAAPAALLVLLALLAAGCGGGSSTSAEGSSSSTTSGAATAEAPATAPAMTLEPGYIDWPFFGRIPQRTHYLPANRAIVDRPLDPPLKRAWSISTHGLIEFPPAIGGRVAYTINKYGNGKAVQLGTHKVIGELTLDPKNKGHQSIVTGPAYYRGLVYGAFLDGTLAAGNVKTEKTVWERHLGAHLESSPLPLDGNLYIGTDKGELLALDAGDGHTIWTFQAPGAIKASPSYDAGKVFVADYQSSMFALNAKTGKTVWRSNTSTVPPYGTGGFFSSPAIAYGNVYAARDDGTVYAFDERTGKVRWSFDTGGAVYGSPSVAKVPGTPATVYIGSENGRFFALDARTGKVRWTYEIGGPVPGTATVIGHTVYVSTFTGPKTLGIDVRTHKKTFQIKEAGYTPVVSDGRRLILVGYFGLVGLEPTTP
ncbi:MAG: PQQ-binding-like beta-propeller repeat protein [Actinobacteria bacterium]|nr:PQQ-binding-like beta-propeller repeat protein [Actinomycetota bacterium]